MALRWTSLDEAAVAGWAELTNLLATHDQTDEFYEAADLAEELCEPGVDPALDTVAVWSGQSLVGFGQLRVSTGLFQGRVRAGIGGGVHPDHRGRGIGAEIMDRLEPRARQLSAERHPGVEVLLRASGGIEGASVRRLLEHRGYRIVRYFHEMSRALPVAPPAEAGQPQAGQPRAEAGQLVQPYRPELSEATRLAHNEAFSTHWGSTPWDVAQWQDFVGSRTLRPELCFVVLGADGAVDALSMARQWVPGEAWIDLVGTRQRARGRGLARACLSATLQAATERGYRTAALGVDSQNGQGAGALYSSLGFDVVRVLASYGKVVPALCGAVTALERERPTGSEYSA